MYPKMQPLLGSDASGRLAGVSRLTAPQSIPVNSSEAPFFTFLYLTLTSFFFGSICLRP